MLVPCWGIRTHTDSKLRRNVISLPTPKQKIWGNPPFAGHEVVFLGVAQKTVPNFVESRLAILALGAGKLSNKAGFDAPRTLFTLNQPTVGEQL